MTTISEAIDSVTEEDVAEVEESMDQGQVVDDNGNVLEDEFEEEGSLLDEPDEEEEYEEEEEDEEETPAEEDGVDLFDELTPEEIAEAKANPLTNKIRKKLMRAWSKKTTEHSELVKLGNSYKSDPVGVLHAIAHSLNMRVTPAMEAAAEAKANELNAQGTAAVDPNASDPGKELEELFGEQIGPKVRAVFDKWAEQRMGKALEPLQKSVQQTEMDKENVRRLGVLQQADSAFRTKHKDLDPRIEKEMIELGNSKKIVPGNLTPEEYLEVLYEVVSARHSRGPKKKDGAASETLARRIAANRRDKEPEGVSGRGGTVRKVSKVSEAKSISEALDIAMAELEEGER